MVPEIDRLVDQFGGTPGSGRLLELGGFPGIRYDEVEVEEPPDGESRLVFLFDGATEYLINCQSTPEERASVEEACDRALSTLKPG